MTMHRITLLSLLIAALFAAACQPAAATPVALSPTPTEDLLALAANVTPIPTIALASATPLPARMPPSATPTVTPTQAPTEQPASEIPLPSATQPPTATPTLERADHYWLARPIAQEGDFVHWVDRTYPYGGTQFGTRDVHLGVEFVNPRFTAVFAAADGTILFAGEDRAIQFGPQRDYYGNLVVIEHNRPSPEGVPLYTLYGHLQDVRVEAGQPITRGERIGRVGDSGVAIGPHLHFEVRVGDVYDYRSTRNPDLWIEPYPGYGTLAGRVHGIPNPYGVVLQVRSDDLQRETYTYGGDRVNSDPAWNENFTLSDLPAGTYEVFISNGNGRTLFRRDVTIAAGQTNWLDVNLGGDE